MVKDIELAYQSKPSGDWTSDCPGCVEFSSAGRTPAQATIPLIEHLRSVHRVDLVTLPLAPTG